ncbi:MAG: hypothetical protein R3318_01005 [Gammaproteobacteria bacterium]|nr:hypothetical protein [Gammaproteobacteria bacterium]
MDIPLHSATDVFLFIIFCSIYVCSILWVFGDAATRGAGKKGMAFPLVFVIAGALALVKGVYLALAVWPVGYVLWFFVRPKEEIELTE